MRSSRDCLRWQINARNSPPAPCMAIPTAGGSASMDKCIFFSLSILILRILRVRFRMSWMQPEHMIQSDRSDRSDPSDRIDRIDRSGMWQYPSIRSVSLPRPPQSFRSEGSAFPRHLSSPAENFSFQPRHHAPFLILRLSLLFAISYLFPFSVYFFFSLFSSYCCASFMGFSMRSCLMS